MSLHMYGIFKDSLESEHVNCVDAYLFVVLITQYPNFWGMYDCQQMSLELDPIMCYLDDMSTDYIFMCMCQLRNTIQ